MNNDQKNAAPIFVAHRGASAYAPENTIAAFKLAHEMQMQWIECDVMMLDDGALIIHHDDTLDRTTNGCGAVAAQNLEKIKALDAGFWFNQQFTGESIPTLQESLDVMEAANLRAIFELKDNGSDHERFISTVSSVILAHWERQGHTPIVFSETKELLKNLKAKMPGRDIITGVVMNDWHENEIKHLQSDGINIACINHEVLNQERVHRLQDAGFEIASFTVNDAVIAATFIDYGVRYIITDYPDLMQSQTFYHELANDN